MRSSPRNHAATRCAPLAALVGALLLGAQATGAELAVTNAGFEADFQGSPVLTGSFPVGSPPTGWSRWDENGAPVPGSLLGVLNPGTQAEYDADGAGLPPCFPAGAPEGTNVALLFRSGGAAADAYGIEQTLSETLTAGMRYRLQVEVGNIQTCAGLPPGFRTVFPLDDFPGYRIELLAGGVPIATEQNGVSPAEGAFETTQLSILVPAGHPQAGLPLAIRLINLNQPGAELPGNNLEVDFDDVRLSVTAPRAVPLPLGLTFAAVPLLAGLGLGIRRRQRRSGPQG